MRNSLASSAILAIILMLSVVGCEKLDREDVDNIKKGSTELKANSKTQQKPTRNRAASTLTQDEALKSMELPSFAGLVKRLQPSVVNISTTSVVKRRPFKPFLSPFGEDDAFGDFFKKFFEDMPQREYNRKGLGTGFLISSDGYIVTNYHVIHKADVINVILEDEHEYEARVVGKDPKTDLAVLKIEADVELPYLDLGDSEETEIGDWVVAIGNPFGLGHTVTAGIVSAKARIIGFGQYDDFIQTDAPINPGNSGGPLFNLKGEVVGVNTAIVARGQGIAFAIPSNLVRTIVDQLKGSGKVVRGWLGVAVQELTPELAEGMGLDVDKGVLVGDVTKGSPADKAGINRGDVIVEMDGKTVEKETDVSLFAANIAPGTEIIVKILREGQVKQLTAVMGELEEKSAAAPEPRKIENNLGVQVTEITPKLAARYNLPRESGVIISKIDRGSTAARAGMVNGDILVEINNKKIKGLDDYAEAMKNIEKGKSNLFLILRGNTTVYIAIKF